MQGLILNISGHLLPEGSRLRTREERRFQPALFLLADGLPVFEVWHYHERLARWFCMSHHYDPAQWRDGVVYYRTMADLKKHLAVLEGAYAAA